MCMILTVFLALFIGIAFMRFGIYEVTTAFSLVFRDFQKNSRYLAIFKLFKANRVLKCSLFI